MSKKKLKDNGIFFTGKASDDVTGSQIFVRYGDSQFLLECGLHQSQSNDYLDSYKINSEKFKFKPYELDYVFVGHAHIDHIGLIPRLVKEGFCGEIIATERTAMIMKPLLLNSCAIIGEEARILSKRYKRNYQPLYEESDVYKALDLIHTYEEYGTVFQLNDNISFQFLRNSHCVGAAQIALTLKDKSGTKKILYTSDIGSLRKKNHYCGETERPNTFYDAVIMESTYGKANRKKAKRRSFDTEHLKSAVDTVIGRRGTVILPCFSFSRTQEILTTLYEIYGKDRSFTASVIVDSKLSCDISELYHSLLKDSDLRLWKDVNEWGNLKYIKEKDESTVCVNDMSPKVIITSSGFCTNGRVVDYLKKYIRDRNSMVIFTGYTGDNPSYLSYRIKNYRDNKTIKINKEMIPNRADCITLSSFSSHAGFDDLVLYGGNLKTNKLILVHGDADAKRNLAEKLTEEISKNNMCYRVIAANRGMTVRL